MADSKKVLIVEDEKSLLKVLSERFTKAGYTVLTASNGKEGLKVAIEQHPDIMLVDLLMPIMNGDAMIAELRKDTWGSSVPIIILSNQSDTDSIVSNANSVVEGAPLNDYFVKSNTSIEQLVAMVEQKLAV